MGQGRWFVVTTKRERAIERTLEHSPVWPSVEAAIADAISKYEAELAAYLQSDETVERVLRAHAAGQVVWENGEYRSATRTEAMRAALREALER